MGNPAICSHGRDPWHCYRWPQRPEGPRRHDVRVDPGLKEAGSDPMPALDRITLALDAMGGDHGAEVVVPAAIDYLRRDPGVDLILVGREEVIRQHLGKAASDTRLRIHNATQEVAMDELPSRALRGKKDSSMRVAIDLVKQGDASACISAGNTGALMATARFVLKMLPMVDRPAIITAIPSIEGHTWMLDLGANVDCSAEHLLPSWAASWSRRWTTRSPTPGSDC